MPADKVGHPPEHGGAGGQRRLATITVRTAILLGFGVTLGFWLYAGSRFASRIEDGEHKSTTIAAQHAQGQQLLSTVRTNVLLASIYMRDALLDATADRPDLDRVRQQILAAYEAAHQALAAYKPVADSPAIEAQLTQLKQLLEEFRTSRLGALESPAAPAASLREVVLRDVVPQRELMFSVLNEVEALDRRSYSEQQAQIDQIYVSTERQIWMSLGAGLLATLAIVLMVTLYVDRLETRLRSQRAVAVQSARDLHRLSMKLVTAQEDERRHIARELHDEVGQLLTALKMQLVLARQAATAGGDAVPALDEVRAVADRAMHTVRDLSQVLHPGVLDDLGLVAALKVQARAFADRSGIDVAFETAGLEERLPAPVEMAAYRIVQETLTNVARHARASGCEVRLSRDREADRLVITVDDNGRGFDPEAPRRDSDSGGLGLIGIRERVAQLGGALRIESAPGRGTCVTVDLALAAPRGGSDFEGAPAMPLVLAPRAGEAHG